MSVPSIHRPGCLWGILVNPDNFIDSGKQQDPAYPLVYMNCRHLSSKRLHQFIATHDHADPGTVHKHRLPKIKDHLFDSPASHQLICLPAYFLCTVMIQLFRNKNDHVAPSHFHKILHLSDIPQSFPYTVASSRTHVRLGTRFWSALLTFTQQNRCAFYTSFRSAQNHCPLDNVCPRGAFILVGDCTSTKTNLLLATYRESSPTKIKKEALTDLFRSV